MNIKHFALSLLLCGSLQIAHASPVLSIDPATQSVTIGNQISFNIDITGLGSGLTLGTYDLSLDFNASLLAYTGIQFSNGLDLFGLGDVQSVTPGAGNVEIFELSLDSANALSVFQLHQFTLATLTFNTLGIGTSPLTLSANALGDGNGNALAVTINNSSASIVPVPASFVLLGSGLLGMLLIERKKRY